MAVDGTDRRIVAALLDDGRASPRELATATDLSTSAVERRLAALERDGVIEGYEPDLDYQALGYDLTALVEVSVDGDTETVVGRLVDDDRFQTVYVVTGQYDLFAVGRFRDAGEMDARLGTVLADADVGDVRTTVVRESVVDGRPPTPTPGD